MIIIQYIHSNMCTVNKCKIQINSPAEETIIRQRGNKASAGKWLFCVRLPCALLQEAGQDRDREELG